MNNLLRDCPEVLNFDIEGDGAFGADDVYAGEGGVGGLPANIFGRSAMQGFKIGYSAHQRKLIARKPANLIRFAALGVPVKTVNAGLPNILDAVFGVAAYMQYQGAADTLH